MPNFNIKKVGDFNYVAEEKPPEDYTKMLKKLLEEKKIQEFKSDGANKEGENLFKIRIKEI
jgi:hypothetical protein